MTVNRTDSPGWNLGETIAIPELFSEEIREGKSSARQLVANSTHGLVTSAAEDRAVLRTESNGEILVLRDSPAGRQRDPYLAPALTGRSILASDPETLSWIGRPSPSDPDSVRAALADRFRLVSETSPSGGFRQPQLGAIQSVLGYWTTDPVRPATVVMPTGTGKTDTMIALFASDRPERLLVLVPSDVLRAQIASKFETLGILPAVGALGDEFAYPVVGRLEHGLKTRVSARRFARACNVVVATPAALNAGDSAARLEFLKAFTHLFVDEAHHVKASTWEDVRSNFADKRVVQFTATPYRQDGQDIGGKLVYVFPLRLAQEQDYFARIGYRGVRNLGNQDEVIATLAVEQLRSDLEAGFDHIAMARVNRIGRARDVAQVYEQVGAEFEPVVLHSSEPVVSQRQALEAVRSRSSRIIICVDMLGEGFDLPSLKIAAIHDPHKSLGITLQFIGRFARVFERVGSATVIVGRPDTLYDENLRSLYQEDADWNGLIRDLSEAATAKEEAASEFDEGFSGNPVGVSASAITPKMSTVVYRTHCDEWQPEAVEERLGPEGLVTLPIPINRREGVAWFVTRNQEPADWGPAFGLEDVTHELYVMYWNRRKELLFINSSNNESKDRHHQSLAKTVAGADAHRIVGDDVFRAYAGIDRLVPTNVGVLDIRNRARKFSMHAGANVEEGFPEVEAQTKTKTNIFAHGHQDGERVSIGASLKGRVWSWRAAGSVLEWVRWCDRMGEKLTNTSLSVNSIMRSFIRPIALESRPAMVVLGLEWPWDVYASTTGDLRVSRSGDECALVDADLRVTRHNKTGPIPIEIRTPDWTARYELELSADGMDVTAESTEVDVISTNRSLTFRSFVRERGLTLLLEDDAVIEPPGVLLQPDRDLEPFDRGRLRTDISWSGTNIRVESQGTDRRSESIQARVVEAMMGESDEWELIIDDDGPGEVADIVALRRDLEHLEIQLTHCKYSSNSNPGARVADLYEVCGQAQKSVNHRRDVNLMIRHLIRREQQRQRGHGRSGIEAGTGEILYEIEHESKLLLPRLTVVIVQPGVSKAAASMPQLELLAATETYVNEVGGGDLQVFVSP